MPLIFGETASGILVPLLLESDGSLPAISKGWIGAAWQKNPLLLGYSGDKSELKQIADASAGTNTLSSGTVPAGETWVVEAISARDLDNAITSMLRNINVNGVVVTLVEQITVAAAARVFWSGAVTLSYGDYVRAAFYGCTLNDNLEMAYHARRIDIDQ